MTIECIGTDVSPTLGILGICLGFLFVVYAFYSAIFEDMVEKKHNNTGTLDQSKIEKKRRKKRDIIAFILLLFGGLIGGIGVMVGLVMNNIADYQVEGKVKSAYVSTYDGATPAVTVVSLEGSDANILYYAKDGEAEKARQFKKGTDLVTYCNLTEEKSQTYSCTDDKSFDIDKGGKEFLERMTDKYGKL